MLAILCLANQFLLVGVPHFSTVGPELLKNSNFEQGLTHWKSSHTAVVDNNSVTLGRAEEPDFIKQEFPVPNSRIVSVATRTALDNVTQGDKRGANARIQINGMTDDGTWQWGRPLKLFTEAGSRDFTSHTGVFFIPSEFKKVSIEAELAGSGGKFIIDSISIFELESNDWIYAALGLFAIFWTGLATIQLYHLRSNRVILTGLAIGAFVIMMPGLRSFLWSRVASILGFASEMVLDVLELIFEKGIHGAIFLLITLLLLQLDVVKIRSTNFFYLPLYAIVSEQVQFLVPGRDLQLSDMIANFLGIVLGVITFLAYRKLTSSRLASR